MAKTTRCGYIAIVGRPNVGKSTLLNRLLEQKISITARKPQTTRQTIIGIKTLEETQLVFVDTPGLHKDSKRALNRYMNKAASSMLGDVAVIVWVVDAGRWTEDDDWVLAKLKKMEKPVILAVNKIDRLADQNQLLPLVDKLSKKMHFAEIVPISAKNGTQVAELERVIAGYLPESEFFYDADQVTDRSERFIAAELIREKLFRNLGQELPYAVTVIIDKYQLQKEVLHIDATIWVERAGQKAIVIGKKGEQLKKIGTAARLDIEKMVDHKVFLQLWVKVKENWADDERALNSLLS